MLSLKKLLHRCTDSDLSMDTITYMFSYFSISAHIARILLVTFYGGGYFLSTLFIPTPKVLEKIVRMPVT